jgi:signal transduction histidine kinase
MQSLRARVAITLVLSIVCVVAMATVATVEIMCRLQERDFSARVARQILLIEPLFRDSKALSGAYLDSKLPVGTRLDDLTTRVQTELHKSGTDIGVIVTRAAGARDPVASIQLKSGWLAIPISEEGPPEGAWVAIGSWILLIGIGVVIVALGFSYRVTRHLSTLERVAATIDADGVLPQLPENGPPELKATARALNTMTARLKSAAESRMRLVAAAGHDLRTPMTRMRLRAEFLEDDEREKWLADLEELDQIADSAMQLVREEVEGEKKQSIRLDEFTARICRDLASMKSPVTLIKSEPVTVWSAPLALTRALRNLILNAATHGGGAFISVVPKGDAALITIEDEGPGIPDQIMPRVFEPFFRVDPGRRKSVPGAGLGLAIAKEIVERHGGQLVLRNRSPRGLRQEVVFSAVSTA